MLERRITARNKTFLGGVISSRQRGSTMDCLVKNFSGSGARLVLTNTATIPTDFDLTITRQERTFRGRIAWRRAEEAGVVFLNETNPTAPIPLVHSTGRRAGGEAETAALPRRVAQLGHRG